MVSCASVEIGGADGVVGVWSMAYGIRRRGEGDCSGVVWGILMKTMIAYISYVWMTTLAGLAIHPYKSVKKMVMSERVLLPVVMSPVMGLVGLFVVGRVGSYAMNLTGLMREGMAMMLGVILIGLLMWQGLLVALVVRFWRAR